MNQQEIFDKVSSHLLEQGKTCKYDGMNSMCLYRGSNGMKCAIGCLIPDEDYSTSIEGDTIHNLILSPFLPENLKKLFIDNFYLLADLQQIHDHVNPLYWKTELIKVAQNYVLIFKG